MLQSSIVMSKSSNITAGRDGDGELALRPLNTRSIALSVLLGSHPPELPARAFVALAELFGIPGGTMRTALSRMVATGEITGADAHYRLAGRLLDRQRAQDVGRRPPRGTWDGRWHTVVAVADQRELAERRRFRSTMANLRFGELRPDIWMRPTNLDRPPGDEGWGDDLIVTTGDLDGVDPNRLTARLWDLAGLDAGARRLLAAMDRRRRECAWDDPRSIPDLFTTSAAVVRFLRNEPLLPTELTPPGWPVDRLRREYDAFEADHQRLLQTFLRRA
jgi:phenylacetic acid degradation operon negative regulatory protein